MTKETITKTLKEEKVTKNGIELKEYYLPGRSEDTDVDMQCETIKLLLEGFEGFPKCTRIVEHDHKGVTVTISASPKGGWVWEANKDRLNEFPSHYTKAEKCPTIQRVLSYYRCNKRQQLLYVDMPTKTVNIFNQ